MTINKVWYTNMKKLEFLSLMPSSVPLPEKEKILIYKKGNDDHWKTHLWK